MIYEIRNLSDKLSYKLSEKSAIAQLAVISKDKTKDIGYLRRRKEQLEFRIATEAFTLEAEKDLIRKKAAIEKELNDALASYRLRKKAEYLNSDIDSLGKRLTELETAIKESDKRLDVYYTNLRRLTGEDKNRNRGKFDKQGVKKEQKNIEVSLADIAVIKESKKEKSEDEELN